MSFGEGLKALINHRDVRNTEEDEYQRLEGTIATISARQEGKLALKCGLEAFFVPKEGSFVQMKDETVDVTFRIGFRPEGLVAFNVRRVTEKVGVLTPPIPEIIEIDEPEIVEPIDPELLKEIDEISSSEPILSNYRKLEGPKIIGKITLDERNIKKRKK